MSVIDQCRSLIYIEALLVNEELTDHVWELWDAGETDDEIACMAWMLFAQFISAQFCAKLLSHYWSNTNFLNHN